MRFASFVALCALVCASALATAPPPGAPDRPLELKFVLSHGAEIELKLTTEQVSKLEALSDDWYGAFPAHKADELKTRAPEFVKKALAVLTDAQRVRAAQLLEWRAVAPNGPLPEDVYAVLNRSPNAVARLKVTPEQLDRMKKALAVPATDYVELYAKGGDVPAAVAADKKRLDGARAAAETVLSAEQLKAYRALFGPTPEFYVITRRGTEYPRKPLAVVERWYIAEHAVSLTADAALCRVVGLTGEQCDRIEALVAKWDTDRDSTPAGRKARAETIAKDALGVMTAEQWARWRAGHLRQLTNDGTRPYESVLALVEFQDAIRPTEEQVRRLLRRELLSDVLTAEQLKTFQELIGTPLKPLRHEMPRDPLSAAYAPLRVIANPTARAELKLNKEQEAKIVAAVEKAIRDRPTPNRSAPPHFVAQRASQIAAFTAYRKTLAGILTAEQNRRLHQLAAHDQFEHAQAVTPYAVPLLRTALNPTDKQMESLERVFDDWATVSRNMGHAPTVADIEKRRRLIREEADRRARAVFTAEQLKALKEALGPLPTPNDPNLKFDPRFEFPKT